MVSTGKGKRRIIAFAALSVVLLISLVLNGWLYSEIELLRQECETLSLKIENSKQNLSKLSEEDIQNWFNGNKVKDED